MNYITINDKQQKLVGSRAMSLVKLVTNDKINKLESVPFNITDNTINTILDNSNMPILRKRLGRILSENGMAAMFILPFRNSYILEAMNVVEYDMVGKIELKVTGTSGKNWTYNNQEYPIYTKVEFINGKPTLTRFIETVVDEDGEVEIINIQDPYVFNMDVLPVEIFFNNDERKSDIEYAGVALDICRLDYFDEAQRSEWERTRTLPKYNLNFTDVDPRTETANIDNGQGYLADDGINSKLGSGQDMVPATVGTQILQSQIVFLEDDIYKKLGLQRDTLNNGSNNHNLEVVMSNQYGLEQLISQRDIRENHWNEFFSKLGKVTGVSIPAVTLEISLIEQSKLDLLKSTVLEAQVKAQNIAAQPNTTKPNQE